jgi:hypothetical protein
MKDGACAPSSGRLDGLSGGHADEPHVETADPVVSHGSPLLWCERLVGEPDQQRPALRVRSSPRRLLQIYLADHLAAGTAGVELVRRAARSNNGTSTGEFLHRLSSAADLETLRRVVSQLGFTSSPPKETLRQPSRSWAG